MFKSSIIINDSLRTLVEGLQEQLRDQNYSEKTISNYVRRLRPIQTYMMDNEIADYSPDVGESYFEYYLSIHNPGRGCKSGIRASINRLNDYYGGVDYIIHHVRPGPDRVPDGFNDACTAYLNSCIENGNSKRTIERKRRALARFLTKCSNSKVTSISDLTPQCIVMACKEVSNIDEWIDIRLFLKYLVEQGMIEIDFSTLVPKSRRDVKLPDTYTTEELNTLEGSINHETLQEKRDYAMVLLADRLAIRSGDIVHLTYDNIDFVNKRINLLQVKTGEELHLILPEDVEEALLDYIDSQSVDLRSGFVFRKAHAPYDHLTSTSVYYTVSKYLKKAGINTDGKKTGPHTLRASLSTSMVNDDVPYEAVRSILGHTSKDSIKHYAKTDIEKLRRCAIPVPFPSGAFQTFLKEASS